MALAILSLFNLYRYTPGRRAWMLGRIAESATPFGLAEIAAVASGLVDSEKALAADFRTWTTVRAGADSAEVGQQLVAADQRRDTVLGGFDTYLGALAGMKERAIGKAAARIQKAVFPEGARKVITLPYPDETAAIEAMLAALENRLASDVTAAGAGDWVEDLKDANGDFVSHYNRLSAAREVDFKALRIQDEVNQGKFLRLVAKVVAATDDPAQLATLLDPVEVQQNAMKALYQSRRVVSDVDATTGDPLPEPVATDAVGSTP